MAEAGASFGSTSVTSGARPMRWGSARDRSPVPAATADGEEPAQVQVVTRSHHWPALRLRLVGEHQAANAAVAVATIERLRYGAFFSSGQSCVLTSRILVPRSRHDAFVAAIRKASSARW